MSTIRTRGRVTRQLVLDAAVACLVEDGYAGFSTLAVQERAGVSRGRMQKQFPRKDDLLLAAMEYLFDTREARLEDFTAAARTAEQRLDAAIAWIWESFHGPLWAAASELWVAARTNPVLAEALLDQERRLGARTREIVEGIVGPDVAAHPQFGEVRDQLISSMRGVAMTYAFTHRDYLTDPHLPGWRRLAHNLLQPARQ